MKINLSSQEKDSIDKTIAVIARLKESAYQHNYDLINCKSKEGSAVTSVELALMESALKILKGACSFGNIADEDD